MWSCHRERAYRSLSEDRGLKRSGRRLRWCPSPKPGRVAMHGGMGGCPATGQKTTVECRPRGTPRWCVDQPEGRPCTDRSRSPTSPFSRSIGSGGQPGMCRSTGRTASDPADDRIAAGEAAAVAGAVADRDHPFRVGRRVVGPLQRLGHVAGHRPGDQSAHRRAAARRRSAGRSARDRSSGLESAWISSSQPLQEPASTCRIARLRPRRARQRVRRAPRPSSLSVAASGDGAGSVSGRRSSPSRRSLRMARPQRSCPE